MRAPLVISYLLVITLGTKESSDSNYPKDVVVDVSAVKKSRKHDCLISTSAAFVSLSQVFRVWTPSVPAGADLGGAGGGLKVQEAGQRPEGKDAGASRQQAALQPWRAQRPVQQPHLQQRMLRTVTASLKVRGHWICIYSKRWDAGGRRLWTKTIKHFMYLSTHVEVGL